MAFSNKVLFLTGGLGGLGLAFAKELLKNGLKGVALVDSNSKTSRKILKDLSYDFGEGKAIFLDVDVRKRNQVEDAFEATIHKFKSLDIVINCAAVAEGNWEECLDVNLKSTYRINKLAMEKYLPNHKIAEEGLVINVPSIFGLHPKVEAPIYSASSSALISITRSLGSEEFYQKYKVKVMALCPGPPDNFPGRYDKILNFRAAQVAEKLPEVMAEGKNGSVWVALKDKPLSEVVTSYHPLS